MFLPFNLLLGQLTLIFKPITKKLFSELPELKFDMFYNCIIVRVASS